MRSMAISPKSRPNGPRFTSLFSIMVVALLSVFAFTYCDGTGYQNKVGGNAIIDQDLPDYANTLRLAKSKLPMQPWNVVINEIVKLGSSFLCGGVLVHSKVALTSASCLDDKKTIQIGVRDINDMLHPVRSIIRHPGYTKGSYYNDLALLVLEQNLDASYLKLVLNFRQLGLNTSDFEAEAHTLYTQWDAHEYTYNSADLRRHLQSRILPRPIPEIRFNHDYFMMPLLRRVAVMENFECEGVLKHVYDHLGLNFTMIFPKGIDNTLFCVRLPSQQTWVEENRGHQLLLNYSTYPIPEDGKLTYALTVLGTRAQAMEGQTGTYSTFCGPLLYANDPAIYTNVAAHHTWMNSVLRHLEYFPVKPCI